MRVVECRAMHCGVVWRGAWMEDACMAIEREQVDDL